MPSQLTDALLKMFRQLKDNPEARVGSLGLEYHAALKISTLTYNEVRMKGKLEERGGPCTSST